jgi:transcriptional regulator with XRE-family HTH domain
MSQLSSTIRRARKAAGLSQPQLAEKASALPGAPEISIKRVAAIERGRLTIRLDDPEEALPWLLRALRLGGEPVLRALGLGGKEAA